MKTDMSLGAEKTDQDCQGSYREAMLWIAVLILAASVIQLSIPYPLDDDTAYHFSVARLIREHGVLDRFPWTRFSWQFDRYADKEFLFHLLFVPFIPLGFNVAARIVGIIGGSVVLLAIFAVLRSDKIRLAGWWALMPLGTAIFVYRFSQVRPHLFSIALAIILLWAYSRRRLLILALVAVVYPLTYVAFWQIPLLMVGAAEGARLLAAGPRFAWKPFLLLVAGIILGIILHPNATNLLQMNWIHMADVLFRNAWGNHMEFNMGEEFEPFYLRHWMEFLLPTAVMAAISVVQAWRYRKEDILLTAFALATLTFCLLTIRTNRFLEYLVPFTALSLAYASRYGGKKWLIPLLLAVSLMYTIATGLPTIKYLAAHDQKTWHFTPHFNFEYFPGMKELTTHGERTWQMNSTVISKIDRLLPRDADVFTCGWEYTGSLLLNLPERDFMVALDPTLFYKRAPNLYELWYRTLKDAPASSADIVRKGFSSRYVVCLDHPSLHPFFDALVSDRNARTLYSDGKWVLIDLEAVKD
jgi:hypothetical protein